MARIIIIILGILILLGAWGVPTAPLLLLIVVAILTAALIFRDTAPNLFAGFQLSTTQQIKVGDYIKLEAGEEGYVTDISWSNTRLKALNESSIVIPNSRLSAHGYQLRAPLEKRKGTLLLYESNVFEGTDRT